MIRIPEDDQTGLTKLALLPEDVMSELRNALTAAAEKKEARSLSPEDVGPIANLPNADLKSIVSAVMGLNHAKAFYELSLDEFVNDVCSAMQSAAPQGFPTTGDANERFGRRIKDFLNIEQIARSAKTTVLRYDHQRTVHSVRILTDMRPIFGSNVEEPPEVVVLTHTLKIAYHLAQRLDEAFFVFDESDLQDLKKAIVRAELKAKSIRAALAGSQLKVISEE